MNVPLIRREVPLYLQDLNPIQAQVHKWDTEVATISAQITKQKRLLVIKSLALVTLAGSALAVSGYLLFLGIAPAIKAHSFLPCIPEPSFWGGSALGLAGLAISSYLFYSLVKNRKDSSERSRKRKQFEEERITANHILDAFRSEKVTQDQRQHALREMEKNQFIELFTTFNQSLSAENYQRTQTDVMMLGEMVVLRPEAATEINPQSLNEASISSIVTYIGSQQPLEKTQIDKLVAFLNADPRFLKDLAISLNQYNADSEQYLFSKLSSQQKIDVLKEIYNRDAAKAIKLVKEVLDIPETVTFMSAYSTSEQSKILTAQLAPRQVEILQNLWANNRSQWQEMVNTSAHTEALNTMVSNFDDAQKAEFFNQIAHKRIAILSEMWGKDSTAVNQTLSSLVEIDEVAKIQLVSFFELISKEKKALQRIVNSLSRSVYEEILLNVLDVEITRMTKAEFKDPDFSSRAAVYSAFEKRSEFKEYDKQGRISSNFKAVTSVISQFSRFTISKKT